MISDVLCALLWIVGITWALIGFAYIVGLIG